MSDVRMQELETAELLPSHETLHCWRGGGSSITLINFGGQSSSASAAGNGIGF
jgi:hypothetical protein